jgi:hypothetical protein
MIAPLPAEEFIAAIWQERRRYVHEGKIKQPHPWRVALSDGKVSRPALVEYVKTRCYFLDPADPPSPPLTKRDFLARKNLTCSHLVESAVPPC